MSNKQTLQSHNTQLQGLIDKANALPDAGSGGSGGGASVETCTVTIQFTSSGDPANVTISGVQYIDGHISPLAIDDYDSNRTTGVTSPYVIENVVKNSTLSISCETYFMLGFVTVDGGEVNIHRPSRRLTVVTITDPIATVTIENAY